jgi:hypothetical protein
VKTNPEALGTTFDNKCSILAEIWNVYRKDEEFSEFVVQNHLGLAIAFAISGGIVEATPTATEIVEGTFNALLSGFEYDEDYGWEDLNEIFSQAEWMPPTSL